jgi:sugar phosphate isomerase/epimerase
MSRDSGLSRRRFIGAAGATAVGAFAPGVSLAHGGRDGGGDGDGHHGRGSRLVPRDRLGLQQWSIRDAITRLDGSVSGYLGGRNFPEDPADRGPLVALPGGFRSVFRYLASVGYHGIEFFSFNQGPNGPITDDAAGDRTIRGWLDEAGLVAAGSHTGGLQQMLDPTYRARQIERAHILGFRMLGTAGNPFPGNPPSGLLADWQKAANDANAVGAALRAEGIKYFFHPEQDWFRFFEDPAHPELARVHRIDWFTDNTDPRLVSFEPDTMHTLAGRARFPDPVDGRLFDVNAWYAHLARQRRLIAWHTKDADRIIPLPAPGTNPFTQERVRPGFFDNPDVVYVGEGSIGQGYPVDPDTEVRGFQETFTRNRLSDPGWFHTESDLGPGRATDPGRSLRWAKVSARYMLRLRESDRDDCDDDRRHWQQRQTA